MVRAQVYRQKKYEAKIDADVIRSRFAALKPTMEEQTTAKFTDLSSMESSIKAILEPLGVPTIQIPFYLNYARELYKLTSNFSGKTLADEAKVKYEKWKARGLDADKLKAIAESFGIDTSGWS
jgi:hypothetical protein